MITRPDRPPCAARATIGEYEIKCLSPQGHRATIHLGSLSLKEKDGTPVHLTVSWRANGERT
jgi:hypothetical protein